MAFPDKMSLEHKINLMPTNGIEAKLRPSFFSRARKSLVAKVITYSLAAFLSFGIVHALSGCDETDRPLQKQQYASDIDKFNNKQMLYQDDDSDGYDSTAVGGTDCNDHNKDVYPAAPELCDGIDNQCPGDVGHKNVDEGCLPSGLTGRIVFVSQNKIESNNRVNFCDIYIMNANGSGKTNLTNNPVFENDWPSPCGNPKWSPNGTKIAFSLDKLGNHSWEIYVIDPDGKNQRKLSSVGDNNPFDELGLNPIWSPSGNKIAFSACNNDYRSSIFTINLDGSGQTSLRGLPICTRAPQEAWSPDGTKVAFTQLPTPPSGNWDIYTRGTRLTNLTNNPATDTFPAWSPNGTKIAFVSDRDGYWNREIYIMNADGSNPTNLTNNPANDAYPIWSPNGFKIAFYSNRDGKLDIYVMNADGSNPTNLTNGSGGISGEYLMAWSPDSTKIAFVSKRDGNNEIYVMNIDGSNQTNITNNPANDNSPSWSP